MTIQNEVFDFINKNISVTRSQIVTAKEYALKQFMSGSSDRTSSMLKKFIDSVEATAPEYITIQSSYDTMSTVRQGINNISWSLAFSEAIWSLVHENILLPLEGTIISEEPNITYTTGVYGRSGYSNGWHFPAYKYSFPDLLVIARSHTQQDNYLLDPDLYLRKLDIKNITNEVEEALKDAIQCFTAELYTPCLAMLTKAIEGAWIELGLALINSRNEGQQLKFKRQSEIFTSDFSSIVKIIRTVMELYEKHDVFEDIVQKSKVRLDDLRNSEIWADCVRESRNDVHYGKELVFPNGFEKVSTLLLAAPAHFKMIYKLISICKGQ